MGMSATAILFFGIVVSTDEYETPKFMQISEDDKELYEEQGETGRFDEFDTYLVHKAGIPFYEEEGNYNKKMSEYCDSIPVDLVMHGTYDYPIYSLAVRGTEMHGDMWDPSSIGKELPVVTQEQIKLFKVWTEKLGLKIEEPQWLMCAIYG